MSNFAGFIALTAMLIGAAILSVGSLTLLNGVSTDLFRKGEDGMFAHKQDSCERARASILNYPGKLRLTYFVGFVPGVVAVIAYFVVHDLRTGEFIKLVPIDWRATIEDRFFTLLMVCVFFYLAYAIMVVLRATQACAIAFSVRQRS